MSVALSERRVTGVLALTHALNKAVAKTMVQTPPEGSGIDSFEFWLPQRIRRIELAFDTDYNHPMESVLMGHDEAVMPFCVRDYRIRDDSGQVVVEATQNHSSRGRHEWKDDRNAAIDHRTGAPVARDPGGFVRCAGLRVMDVSQRLTQSLRSWLGPVSLRPLGVRSKKT